MSKALFLRRGYAISQEYIAQKLGISRKTLSKKEKGESDFTKSEMVIYTDILKQYDPALTIDKIFFN
jgi:DNA-binding XRE family transcriptional regulator